MEFKKIDPANRWSSSELAAGGLKLAGDRQNGMAFWALAFWALSRPFAALRDEEQ